MAEPTPFDPRRPEPISLVPFSEPGGFGARLRTPISSLVGREADVAAVAALFQEPAVRLVTLTGPGGVGKTRLAWAVADVLASCFAGGIRVVELAPVLDATLVGPTIARTFGVHESGDRPLIEQVAVAIRDTELLLFIDNFEHVLAAAPSITDLLSALPRLSVLATSRERLRLGGEREFPVSPLPLPERLTPDEIAVSHENAALRLFVERAVEIEPGFVVTAENAGTIAEICRRLDGLPLAIELAAARSKVLPPQALLRRLERRLPLLVDGRRDAPARQQTLRDAIAWSYGLLTDDEQILFRRLAVFVGGFTLEAAEAVCGEAARRPGGQEQRGVAMPRSRDSSGLLYPRSSPVPPPVLDGLASLVDKSLVRREATSDRGGNGDGLRFSMLETIREFAVEKLEASGDLSPVRDRHAAWCVSLAEQADPHLLMPGQESWLEQIETEHPNVRAAQEWLEAVGATEQVLRLAGAMRWFWLVRGHFREGSAILERALPDTSQVPPVVRARALTGLGFLTAVQGRTRGALEVLTEALTLAQVAGDPWETGWALHGLGLAAGYRGDYDRAEKHYDAALVNFRRLATIRPAALVRVTAVLSDLVWVAFNRGELSLATARAEEALAAERELGFTWLGGLMSNHLGVIALYQGDHDRALVCFGDALTVAMNHRDQRIIAQALEGISGVAAADGKAEVAGRLLGAATALREAIGVPPWGTGPTNEQRISVQLMGRDEASFHRARDEGRRLPLGRAIAEARVLVEARDRPLQRSNASSGGSYGLTPREYEVLRLIAAGRSNADIADALFISVRTVTTHATTILNKLGLSSRAEVIAFAHREGLA